MDNKFDIKSSTIDKGLDIAKNFLEKLVMPTVEETGLLVKDHITMWRFKNQIRMLNKAKEYCEKNKIEFKKITLKILAPLLEYSSLEENEEMQNKWSILLSNLIDSKQNIENHVFPYILSQLSKDEFYSLEEIYNNKLERVKTVNLNLKKFREEKAHKEQELTEQIEKIGTIIKQKTEEEGTPHPYNSEIAKLEGEKNDLEYRLKKIRREERTILIDRAKPERFSEHCFKEFELSNLIRLGLLKEITNFYIPRTGWVYSNLENIKADFTTEYILTELGELFFKACKEVNSN
ncbi:hypothetical protein HZP46_07265 [Elizabethkingia anophelis]|nr:hypothetical protein [Elizabethkingia anophelis]